MQAVGSFNLVHRLRSSLSLTFQATVLVENQKLPSVGEEAVHSLADAGSREVGKDHHVGVEAVGAELHHLDD